MPHGVTIDPEALYDERTIRRDLGLSGAALAAAKRSGALRFAKHGHRILYRGSWILDWIEAGSRPAPAPQPDDSHEAKEAPP